MAMSVPDWREKRWTRLGAGWCLVACLGFVCVGWLSAQEPGVVQGGGPGPGPGPVGAAGRAVVPVTNMIALAPGSFVRLRQRVTLSREYWLGKYEVTQAEFQAVTGKNPSHFATDPRLPVEKVSQAGAAAYCVLLTQREQAAGRLPAGYAYRLPTEAEWEYACRAGGTNHFSFGDDVAEAGAYAWTEENSEAKTHPIGTKRPNAWGFHDMHGNVWEWCQDWFGQYPAVEVTDPQGPAEGKFKVFRGGGWNNEAKFARSSNRFMMAATNGIHFVGFRVALSRVEPPRAGVR